MLWIGTRTRVLESRLLVDKLFWKRREWRRRHLANWMVYKRWYFKLALNMKGGRRREAAAGCKRVWKKKTISNYLKIETAHLQNSVIHQGLVNSVEKSCLIVLSAVELKWLHGKKNCAVEFCFKTGQLVKSSIIPHSTPDFLSLWGPNVVVRNIFFKVQYTQWMHTQNAPSFPRSRS